MLLSILVENTWMDLEGLPNNGVACFWNGRYQKQATFLGKKKRLQNISVHLLSADDCGKYDVIQLHVTIYWVPNRWLLWCEALELQVEKRH